LFRSDYLQIFVIFVDKPVLFLLHTFSALFVKVSCFVGVYKFILIVFMIRNYYA